MRVVGASSFWQCAREDAALGDIYLLSDTGGGRKIGATNFDTNYIHSYICRRIFGWVIHHRDN